MQTQGNLKFTKLPKEIQERLLKRQRGRGEGFAFRAVGITSAIVLILAAIVWIAIVFYLADDYLWSDFEKIFVGIISLAAVYLLLHNLYKLFQWITSRSKGCLLITPRYVIDMRFNDVWYCQIDKLAAPKIVHHQQNGRYSFSQINLPFEKGETKTFTVKDFETAEQTVEQTYYFKKRFAEAMAKNDTAYLNSIDDFLELKNQPNQLNSRIYGKNTKRLVTAAAALMITAGMMTGAFALNNFYDDKKSWEEAESVNRASGYRTYLQTHPQGRKVNDANQNLQNLYDAAERNYRTSLMEGYDQKAVDVVLEMLKYARRTQNYRVRVGFERHNEIPSDIVEQLKKDYEVKKILPFDDAFSEDKMLHRESSLLAVVTNAFREVIPDDILEFAKDCESECIAFSIKYKVNSKDSIYYDPREKKVPFAERVWNPGIFIDWDFGIQIPNQTQTYNFSLTSQPAEYFTYDSSRTDALSGKVDVENEMKTDKNNMYDSMVSSAFDDFRTNLVNRMGIKAIPKKVDEHVDDSDTASTFKTERADN